MLFPWRKEANSYIRAVTPRPVKIGAVLTFVTFRFHAADHVFPGGTPLAEGSLAPWRFRITMPKQQCRYEFDDINKTILVNSPLERGDPNEMV
ncbi:hypothetical protein CYPRO_2218 [Cyclonatronum proteinivorum]|uniref:Uncharacterized protein n=1 Tax=Cyclonatronum proteinivorum TaxID=1457365 RepID=A0A345ULW4_9BACT|nr:hypothetical protein CYPRO_2218 [Cyclonatronum proteinivorum]